MAKKKTESKTQKNARFSIRQQSARVRSEHNNLTPSRPAGTDATAALVGLLQLLAASRLREVPGTMVGGAAAACSRQRPAFVGRSVAGSLAPPASEPFTLPTSMTLCFADRLGFRAPRSTCVAHVANERARFAAGLQRRNFAAALQRRQRERLVA